MCTFKRNESPSRSQFLTIISSTSPFPWHMPSSLWWACLPRPAACYELHYPDSRALLCRRTNEGLREIAFHVHEIHLEGISSVFLSAVVLVDLHSVHLIWFLSIWLVVSSVAQLCPTLCNPMNHSMPGLPVHHQLLESTQTHVHWVGDAIQPSHPLSSPSPPALNLILYLF